MQDVFATTFKFAVLGEQCLSGDLNFPQIEKTTFI